MNNIKTELKKMEVVKDLAGKKVNITRAFDASRDLVWRAWTESELLDQWWAPKPWKAETKSFDFKPGGSWIYAMVGPANEKHWAKVEYLQINPIDNFKAIDAFSDEEGNINRELPVMNWTVEFKEAGDSTKVLVELVFESEAHLHKLVEMGFESGFAAALENLDELLESKF